MFPLYSSLLFLLLGYRRVVSNWYPCFRPWYVCTGRRCGTGTAGESGAAARSRCMDGPRKQSRIRNSARVPPSSSHDDVQFMLFDRAVPMDTTVEGRVRVLPRTGSKAQYTKPLASSRGIATENPRPTCSLLHAPIPHSSTAQSLPRLYSPSPTTLVAPFRRSERVCSRRSTTAVPLSRQSMLRQSASRRMLLAKGEAAFSHGTCMTMRGRTQRRPQAQCHNIDATRGKAATVRRAAKMSWKQTTGRHWRKKR